MREYSLDEQGRIKIPSMAEYAMAKKEFEMGVDKASEKADETVVALYLDPNEYPELYWLLIPENQKRKISIGKHHDEKYRYSVSKLS
jgi:hypothetical protein